MGNVISWYQVEISCGVWNRRYHVTVLAIFIAVANQVIILLDNFIFWFKTSRPSMKLTAEAS